jgi:mannose-6-phosphate isomerase-like protein (cupin superfamily)
MEEEFRMSVTSMSIERLVHPGEGPTVDLDGVFVSRKIDADETGDRFSVVEHRIAPGSLAAPLHVHQNEDEFTYVLEGTLGAILGDELAIVTPGMWMLKPRGEWHAFWNAGVSLCRIVDVISPAGFEDYFREMAAAFEEADGGRAALERFAAVNERYGLEMDFDSIPDLCHHFGLTHPMA